MPRRRSVEIRFCNFLSGLFHSSSVRVPALSTAERRPQRRKPTTCLLARYLLPSLGDVTRVLWSSDTGGCRCFAIQIAILIICIAVLVRSVECGGAGSNLKTGRSQQAVEGSKRGTRGLRSSWTGLHGGDTPLLQPRTGDGSGLPCVYEGHIDTEKNWFGYIANISVRTTGQMGFEFAYPVQKCCQNVLFYAEDQLAVMSPRMNCWQREYLLRPEDDQILRLTPSFSWSGCHKTDFGGIETFVCKGGRSFSVDASGDRLTTWHVAVSNCAAQQGIDLYYRLEIYGHVGDCLRVPPQPLHETGSSLVVGGAAVAGEDVGRSGGPSTLSPPAAPKASLMPRDASNTRQAVDAETCVLQGRVNSSKTWFGFVRNISLGTGGGYRYHFTYPQDLQVQNIILYNEDDIQKLDWELTCWEKEEIIGQHQMEDQILELHARAKHNGCTASDNGTQHTVCRGVKHYAYPRKIYMALSNCRSNQGVQLQYRLEVFGYSAESLCSGGVTAAGGGWWIFVTCLIVAWLTAGEELTRLIPPARSRGRSRGVISDQSVVLNVTASACVANGSNCNKCDGVGADVESEWRLDWRRLLHLSRQGLYQSMADRTA